MYFPVFGLHLGLHYLLVLYVVLWAAGRSDRCSLVYPA